MIHLIMKKKYYKVLFFITAFVVFVLAIVPDDQIKLTVDNADKIKHFTAFFVLSFLLNRASSTIVHRLRNMGALLLFGISIEIVQLFLPARESSIEDVIADSVGILVFQLLLSIFRLLKHYYQKQK
ncbi:MAG TPA: VanZ family protein [Campylobacterales bacterium]|jgi:VanZ family protein|nr:VanZ family protein [Campylobacterales bacterium]